MAVRLEDEETVTLRFPFADFREVEGNFGQQFMYSVDTGSGLDRLFANPALHLRLQEYGLTPGCSVSITPTRRPDRRREWVVTNPMVVEPPPGPTPPKPAAKLTRKAETPAPAATPAASAPTNSNGHPPAVTESGQPPVVPANGNGTANATPAPAKTNGPASASPLPSAPANGRAKPGANGHSNGRPSPVDLTSLALLMVHCLSASSQAWANVEHVQYTPGDVRAVGITLFLECRRLGVALPQILAESTPVEKALTGTDDLPF